MRFDKVLIMGSNKIACDCMTSLAGKVGNEKLSVLETVSPSVSMLFKLSRKHEVEYVSITDTGQITEYLMEYVSNRKVLIISANNRYIFREALISQPNVEIINFHYALLPAYRGMNIPTWVIFNGESETGITWHYVAKEIDHGSIIAQRRIEIHEDTTAFDITRKGMQLAQEAFASFYEELLEKEIKGREVLYPQDGKVYKARELPDNGRLNLDKPLPYIGRVLRAYDYRGMGLIPKLRLVINGTEYCVEKYSIQRTGDSSERVQEYHGDTVVMKENDMVITVGVSPMEINE